jgi:4-diphosphocytidyl-2-C-methyl-D-erythritol kinase
MKRRAYAKINLTIDILNKRNDGYHNLSMIMTPIDLYDIVSLEFSDKLTFSSNAHYLQISEDNSIIKAIRLMQAKYQIKSEFAVELKKVIPSRAGLAGGSSDAAATIHLVNDLCHLGLSMNEMKEIALQIGKDVVFCLGDRAALVEGTGELITPITNHCHFNLVLVKPQQGVSTKEAYEQLDLLTIKHYPAQPMIDALNDGDYQAMIKALGNALEDVSIKQLPVIQTIKNELLELGFDGCLMSGSGSCVFGVTLNEELCISATKMLRKKYPFVWMTKVKG